MNECHFIGNLTRDPRLTQTKNGSQFVSFGMATNRWYKRSDGENANEATFLECQAWDSGAKAIADKFKCGDRIGVTASAKNIVWVDTEGKEHTSVIFRVSRFHDLRYKRDNETLSEGDS